MTTTQSATHTDLLLAARADLCAAKHALAGKDSMENRDWLEQARARVDVLLDEALDHDDQ